MYVIPSVKNGDVLSNTCLQMGQRFSVILTGTVIDVGRYVMACIVIRTAVEGPNDWPLSLGPLSTRGV